MGMSGDNGFTNPSGFEEVQGQEIERRSADRPVDNDRRDGTDRRAERRRVLKGVKVEFEEGRFSLSGILKNVSETGARVDMSEPHLVPDNITIINDLDGYMVEAEVIRRDGKGVGIKFTSEFVEVQKKRTQSVGMLNTVAFQHKSDVSSETPMPEQEQQPVRRAAPVAKKPVFGSRR